MSIPVAARSSGFAAARLLGLRVRFLPEAWVSLGCECYVLSGRGLCVGLITLPEESYVVRACPVSVIAKGRPWPGMDRNAAEIKPSQLTKNHLNFLFK
jgi:hypothetical protein